MADIKIHRYMIPLGGAVSDADFERMKSMIPDCTTHEMSSPDHNVQLADKAEFSGYFDVFLEKMMP
jgi:hypothetical protein